MSRLHPVADFDDLLYVSPITSSPSRLSDSSLPSPGQLITSTVDKDNNITTSNSIPISSITNVKNLELTSAPQELEIAVEAPENKSPTPAKETAEEDNNYRENIAD